MNLGTRRPLVYPVRKTAFVLILLAFSRIYFADSPYPPPKIPAAAEALGPPEGMTQQEWNRTAVVDLTGDSDRPPVPKPTAADKRGVYPLAPGVQSVQDDPDAVRVYPVETLVNHATLIQVPGAVSRAWCGDLQAWTLEGDANYVSVKPLATNLSTNLHVLTADGRMYNFRLTSGQGGSYTDVFQVKATPGYEAKQEKARQDREAELKNRLDEEYAKKLKEDTDSAQAEWARDFAGRTYFDYSVQEGRAFRVEGVFNDESFTYFRVRGDEKPTLFLETRQGRWPFRKWTRELVNFNVTGGDFYRVQKLLEPGQRFVLKLRKEEVKIRRRGAR